MSGPSERSTKPREPTAIHAHRQLAADLQAALWLEAANELASQARQLAVFPAAHVPDSFRAGRRKAFALLESRFANGAVIAQPVHIARGRSTLR